MERKRERKRTTKRTRESTFLSKDMRETAQQHRTRIYSTTADPFSGFTTALSASVASQSSLGRDIILFRVAFHWQ